MAKDEYLGKLVVVKWATGEFHSVGVCISYTDRPTIGVELPDGSQMNWIADLCEVKDIGQEAAESLLSNFRKRAAEPSQPEGMERSK